MGNKKQKREYRWVDEKSGLVWERFNPATPLEYADYNELVNIWSGDRTIQKFIHLDEPIADMFSALLRTDPYDSEAFFYAFDNDNLAGVTYITAPIDEYEETNIEYLIVNPRMKGMGIGTRMVSSIKSNPKFFAESHIDTFTASIEHTNEASKRVFIKNGFKMYKPVLNEKLVAMGVLNVHNLSSKFGRWYFTERAPEKTND